MTQLTSHRVAHAAATYRRDDTDRPRKESFDRKIVFPSSDGRTRDIIDAAFRALPAAPTAPRVPRMCHGCATIIKMMFIPAAQSRWSPSTTTSDRQSRVTW